MKHSEARVVELCGRSRDVSDSSPLMRKCKTCGEEKPLTVDFYHLCGPVGTARKRYFEKACFVCVAAKQRKWRQENLTESRATYAAYRAENKEKMNAHNRAWRLRHGDRLRKEGIIRRFKNKDKLQPYMREKARIWREANREQYRLNSKRQRAIRRGVRIETVTKKQIDELRIKQRGRCGICKKKLVAQNIDHVMPIAKGGAHEIKNLQLLCPKCNAEKHDTHPIDYMQRLGFLL